MTGSPQLQEILLTWSVPAVLVLIAILLQWPVIRNALYEKKLLSTINRFGEKALHDIMLPDGLGGMTYIEHLVLTPAQIIVIYLKRYRGNIFASDNIEEWTQVIERNSYRFPNPLRQLEMETMAVSSIVANAEVNGLVVFTDESNFPKGKPERVVLFSEFEKTVNSLEKKNVPEDLNAAWATLVKSSEACNPEFIKNMHETRNVQGNGALAGFAIVVAVLWLVWKLVLA